MYYAMLAKIIKTLNDVTLQIYFPAPYFEIPFSIELYFAAIHIHGRDLQKGDGLIHIFAKFP